MTNKKLKILAEFQNRANKAVLVNLAPEVLAKLNIDDKGMVNTLDFIMACLAEMPENQTSYSLEQLIFDSEIAVKGKKQ